MLFSLITFATGLARSGNELVTLRCLLGVSEAVFLPPALAYIASYHLDRTRSLANSIALSGLTAGAGLGSWYGGFMTEHYSWRIGFFKVFLTAGGVWQRADVFSGESYGSTSDMRVHFGLGRNQDRET